MNEKNLRKRLKDHWKPCHITGVEQSFSSGIPDVHATVENARAWIELKQNYSNKLIFRPNQLGWMEREYQLGAETWIIWFDSRLRCATYTFLREWEKKPSKDQVKITIYQPEVFTGGFLEVKDIIFGVVQAGPSVV